MASILVTWDNANYGHEEIRVYRSTSTIDPGALPVPLAVLSASALQYEDATASPGTQYFYRIGVYINGGVQVSAEVTHTIALYLRADTKIAIVSSSASYNVCLKDSLVAAGYTLANITEYDDLFAGPIPPASTDVLICQYTYYVQTVWDTLVSPAWAAGIPVLFGSVRAAQGTTGNTFLCTLAGITGTWQRISATAYSSLHFDESIIDDTHAITAPLITTAPESIQTMTTRTKGDLLDVAEPYIGTALAKGYSDETTISNQFSVIAVPNGTARLSAMGNSPAKAAVWSNFDELGSAYTPAFTASGRALLSNLIDWLAGGL